MYLSPRISVMWLNFNGLHILELLKTSLVSIFELNYANFEVIIIDNNSTDGSREVIESFVNSIKPTNINVKFVNLKTNIGFCGGINAAYQARDPSSKYVALINNDAIPKFDYLQKIVQFMEIHDCVGAVQGIVVRLNGKQMVDSGAYYLDAALNSRSSDYKKTVSSVLKPTLVSYVEGTMPVYRISAIEQSVGNTKTMFAKNGFMFFLEDVFLSIMLWNHNYACVILPDITAQHERGPSIKRFVAAYNIPYYYQRNRIALFYMTNSKFRRIYLLLVLGRLFLNKDGFSYKARIKRRFVLWALIEGRRLGKSLREQYGVLDVNKLPLVKVSYIKLIFEIFKDLVPTRLLVLFNATDYGISD